MKDCSNQENQPQYVHQDTDMNQPSFPSSDGIPINNVSTYSEKHDPN